MASRIITVDDLIADVRSMLDEDNRESVTNEDDILPALNRAQDYASNILARHYESPMLRHLALTTVSGQKEYRIPEDAFEDRLEKLEIQNNNLYYEVNRIDYRDISGWETQGPSSIPQCYVVIGNKFRLLPASNGTYNIRAWYLKDPPPLVIQQGRINTVNAANNYIIVDEVGEGLTTEVDNLDSYINIIDGHTGERKASFQVKSIAGNRINFKSVPSRTSVLNTNIDTDMTALLLNSDENEQAGDLVIEPDDYICVLKGSCIPFFKKPFTNFLIQYAIAELRRKLGSPSDMEQRVLKELEKQVERSWVGREQSMRVSKKNSKWDFPLRRSYSNKR